jgi:beta-fructofuranosidase
MTVDADFTNRPLDQADFQRPRFHFLPPFNWMNDPNGLIHWRGEYHLFYQFNPNGPLWGDIHWGHAVSSDLVHWRDLPIALAPTPGGPDETGCFSGCIVNDHGTPTLLYTGVTGTRYDVQTQCVAVSHDDLLTWQKYAGNPVLSDVPAESGQTADFRDPFVWKEGDSWYMLIGSHIEGVGGTAFLYRSTDLINWAYLNPIIVGEKSVSGVNWECPNFFPLGDKWVLIISVHSQPATGMVQYFVGDYHDFRFIPQVQGVVDAGAMYAPLTMLDAQGRRLMVGWLREMRSETDQRRAGWSGVQSVPRLLSLDAHNRLVTTPVPEIETIRGLHFGVESLDLDGDHALAFTGQYLDITAEFAVAPRGICGLRLASNDDATECTEILYDAKSRRLTVRSTTPDFSKVRVWEGRDVPHLLDPDENFSLRVLLDGSVVEIIANGRTSVTHRSYTTSPDCDRLALFGHNAQLQRIDLWEMPSIWQ